MGLIKIVAALIVLITLGSIIMIFIRGLRKIGLVIFGVILLTVAATLIIVFRPVKYERSYLGKSAEWKELSVRRYADSVNFYIGAIPSGYKLSDPLFSRNFNSITPENALKMGPLLRNMQIGEYDFSKADKIVDEALANNIRVRGHTLVWGKQVDMFKNPDISKWLEKFPKEEREKKLKEITDNHIITVLNHFRGRIKTWDCVNEPTSISKVGSLEDNVYSKYLGEDYISDAFRLAHLTDTTLKLFLNEQISNYNNKQAECLFDLVSKLKKNNVPINGVGLQSHILTKTDTAIADLKKYIKRFTDIGLEVEITELDIRLRIFNAAKDPFEAQGRYYARIIEACLENPLCKGVTFWGFSDSRCWMNSFPLPKPNDPYFFDTEMYPKPAFYEVYKTMKDAFERRGSNNSFH